MTFEGGEGSGKSTQAGLLNRRLGKEGYRAAFVREPGGTELGEELRNVLMHRGTNISAEAELLLFLAARAELVRKVIRPALEEGVVVCDRFADSTLAYQGYGRGLDLKAIRDLNNWATGGLSADLTVLLDLPVDAGRRRKQADDDTFTREDDAFHERVRQGYAALAAAEPARWLVIDGALPPEVAAERTWERVRGLLIPKA